MGFLSGAYGKIMAGKLVRQLQWQLTSVQSRLNRVTKQVGDMEQNFQRMERMENLRNTSLFNAMRSGMMSNMQFANNPELAAQYQEQASKEYNNYLMGVQSLQQGFAMEQAMCAEQFDIMREAQLEPLKALEDQLQTEKDNLESRLELAKGQYDAKKKEEQDGAKNMVPDYTGGG